jgi:hypothetical protein
MEAPPSRRPAACRGAPLVIGQRNAGSQFIALVRGDKRAVGAGAGTSGEEGGDQCNA